MIDMAAKLAHIGVLRATNVIGRNAEGLPAQDYRTARMFASSPQHLRTSHAELLTWEETMAAARQNRSLGDRPLLVLSASETMAGMPTEMIPMNRRCMRSLQRSPLEAGT